MSRLVGVLLLVSLVLGSGWLLKPLPARGAALGMITSAAELAALPMSGPAWDRMKAAADGSLGTPKIGDFNNDHDVLTLAVALVYGRTGIESYRTKAADAIMSAIGTEDGGQAVMLGRNLISYIIAADLIDFASFDPAREAQFRSWLSAVRFEVFSDGSIVSEDRKRANNHGRVAGASRLAASLYLGDGADLAEAIAIFKGWLGDRSSYNAFTWNNDLSWQADPTHPVGVNPVGATKNGFSIDGALPEEMRRGCSFTVPPCATTYPWGAFQGVLLVAEILNRQGYDAWGWQDRGLLRAADFLHDLDVAYGGWWAKGDDTWQPWLINHAYGTTYPTEPVTTLGKTFAWSDWLWGPGSGGGGGGGGGNAAPLCNALSLTTAQDSTGADVAPSCTDANTDPLTYAIAINGGKGVASVTATSQLHYTPNAGASGTDTFTYIANDGIASSAPATVNVTITPSGGGGSPVTVSPVADTYVRSDTPTVANGSSSTLRSRGSAALQINSYLRFTISGVVGAVSSATLRLYVSDASVDAGSLYRISDNTWSEGMLYGAQPTLGTAIVDLGPVVAGGYRDINVSSYVTGNGTYSFALLGENSDSAQFHSREGVNHPLLVVTPGTGGGNVAPVCSDRSLTVAQNTAGDVAPSCTDAELDPLTYAIASPPSKGVASVTGGPGTYQLHYTPNTGASGGDSFTYIANDGTASSAPATISVTITPTGGGTPVTVSPVADTYVRSDTPSVANGSSSTLRSRGGSTQINSYLRFTFSGVVGTVSSATLRLYVSDVSVDAGSLYRIADNTWSEGMLYTGQPTLGAIIVDLGAVPSVGYMDIDVSSYVSGNGTYSFALLGESSDVAQFHSREGVNDPLLVVTP